MKLFATDLDGTIVHEVDKVEKASIDAIKELQKNGVLVAVSTGRIFSGVKFLKENYGLSLDYFVLGNGSVVMDKDHKIIYKSVIDYDTVKKIYNYFLNKCVIGFIC